MSKTESWKTWTAVIVILVAFSLFAALWPALSGSFSTVSFSNGPRTKLPNITAPVIIEMPPVIQVPGLELADMVSFPGPTINVALPEIEIPGVLTVEPQTIIFVKPIYAVLIVAAIVIGAVVVTGLIIGLVYVFLARWAARTEESEAYKENAASLEQKEQVKLKAMNDGRVTASAPENPGMPRWSVISTALLICMFVIFGSMVVATTFFPTRIIDVNDQLLRPATIIVGVPLLMAIAILLFAPRWGKAALAIIIMLLMALVTVAVTNIAGLDLALSAMVSLMGLVQIIILVVLALIWRPTPVGIRKEKAEETKDASLGIPYDAIVVLFTGLFVVGLGLGLTLLINSDYYEQIRTFLGF